MISFFFLYVKIDLHIFRVKLINCISSASYLKEEEEKYRREELGKNTCNLN